MAELVRPDLTQKGMDLLPSFWDDKPKAQGLMRSFLESLENPLDLLFEVLNGTALNDAVGNQLDDIGDLWNVGRQGDTDEAYRARLFSRITQQIADGTPEKVIEILKVASSATQVKLFEHYPGNIHVGMDVSLIESIKALGDSITPAGVSFNARFEPTQDGVSGTRPTAFGYRSFDLLTGSWVNGNGVIYTPNTDTAPDGNNTVFSLQDSSGVAYGYRYQTYTIDPTKRYFAGVWIKQDLAATHNAAFSVSITGGAVQELYTFDVSPVDGSFSEIAQTPIKTRVLDLDTWYFVWIEFDITDQGHTTLSFEMYPAFSTTLGTPSQSTTGTTEFWSPNLALVDTTKHNSAYETQGTLVCSERFLNDYTVIDEAGDFVVDEALDQIIAQVDSRYTGTGSMPLAEFGDTTHAQPLTEVI